MPQFKASALAALLAASAVSDVSSFGILPTANRRQIPTFLPKAAKLSMPPKATAASSRRIANSRSRSGSRNTWTMLVETSGGMEELYELTEQCPAVARQIRKSPSLWKIAGYASIPLSAALGFGLVPSRRLAAHTVGAVVTGALGAVGKTKMDDIAETMAAKPAIAQAILDHGLENTETTQHHVKAVQNLFGVLDEDFASMCTDVYQRYLLGMIKYNPTPKTSELKELDQLKTVLGMDNLAVGEAHATAAAEWYRATCLFTPEEDLDDPEHPDRLAMDKFLFLTERALRQGGETEEAFVFEMTRVARALDLDLQTALDRVAAVVEPFYQRALKSTRSKLGTSQVSSAMLERARKTLGVDEVTAQDMHVACFNEEVRELLGRIDETEEEDSASSLKFVDGAMERLDQLRDILGLTDSDANYEISLEATPLFQATALADIKDLLAGTKSAEDAWNDLSARGEELLLNDESTKKLLSSLVMQALGGPLEESNKFAKVNNEAATYDHLHEALEAKQALIAILAKSGWDEFDNFDATFCDPHDRHSANGFLSFMERRKLYKIFLNRTVRKAEGGKLSDEMYDTLMQVKGLLGITDEQAEDEAHAVFGPELSKTLQSAMNEVLEDYTPELVVNLQKDIDEMVANYHLSEDYVKQVGAGLYGKAVETINDKAPGGIPTVEQNEALDAIRGLFKLSKEDTFEPHIDNFGPVYRKSVLEAMGSTGVIQPEYRKSLDQLRDRLGVSEDACKNIFLEAVEEKMKPMVEWIVSEMERTMLTQRQLSQRRKKDMGEDLFQTGKGATGVLGLGAEVNVMSDIMNLVDFYTENEIAEKKQVGTKTVEKKVPADEEGGEEKSVSEEVPIYETTYPVTGLAIGAVDQEMAELLYRQFVVGGFTNQGPQAARYEGAKGTFGGILGLTSEKMEEISSTIAGTVYDNLISNSMKTKGTLDQQDMMFLANIQGKLGLSSEQSEKMLLDSQKKVLSEEIDALMDDPTPEGLKAFREKCNSMGMDLAEDVGISQSRLAKMFEYELIPGLKSGEISVDSVETLTEMQESLGMSEEDCASIFESILGRLAKTAFELISGELLRGREEKTVDLIKELVRYASFVDGDLGLNVPEATGYQIYNIYEALDFGDEDVETVEDNKALLKTTLSLS